MKMGSKSVRLVIHIVRPALDLLILNVSLAIILSLQLKLMPLPALAPVHLNSTLILPISAKVSY